MAKTIFSAGNQSTGTKGTKVTAGFLNSVQNHRHDGLDQDGSATLDFAVAGGTSNAITVALPVALTQHIVGLSIYFRVSTTNTGAATIQLNGAAAVALKNMFGGALVAGDLVAGQIVQISYDGASYRLISTNLFKSQADALYQPLNSINASAPYTRYEAGLRLIRGDVNADGSKALGQGFTIVHASAGSYAVTFTAPFSSLPTVVVTSHNTGQDAEVVSNSAAGFSVLCHYSTNTGMIIDTGFSFIAIGPD